jgi:uracil-DNA glycosylase family 4
MIVGEAPGREEDREGRPFIGQAGKLLDTLMEQAGLSRESVFITNAVRCRPVDSRGDNRAPTVSEAKACKHHLVREVQELRPKLIIALGNTPLRALTGMSGIKVYRGGFHDLHKTVWPASDPEIGPKVLPTWHPSYVLPGRAPEREPELIQDLQTARRHLQGGHREIETPFIPYDAFGPQPNSNEKVWGWDIETNAREMHDPELRVWFMSIDDGTNIFIFFERDVQLAATFMDDFIARGGWLVGHNASSFDRRVIKERYGINLKTHDTQLVAHRVDETQPLKLQDLAIRWLGVAPWKEDMFTGEFWRRGPQGEEEWYQALLYNARDTRYVRLLFLELWPMMSPGEQNLYLKHNLPCSRALSQVERNGVYISEENAHKAISELDVDQRAAILLLKSHIDPHFNPGSHQQVRDVLYGNLMLPVMKRIKGSPDASTDEEALQKLKAAGLEPEIVDHILAFRENTKLLSSARDYLERALKGYTDRKGMFHPSLTPPRIYPRYSTTTTVNDRTSCFEPNLQNVSRDKRIRSIIAAPPGYVLMEADASQLELRMAAELAGPSSALWQEYQKPKPDVHLTMAARITSKPPEQVTEDERSRAKPPNFAYLYHSDWPTYVRIALTDYGLVISEREARFAQDAFMEWRVSGWWSRIEEELKATGCVTSIFGSKRRLPNFFSGDAYSRLEALRMGINFSDASPASHLVQLWLTQLVGRGLFVCGYIHDAVHVLVPDDPAQIKWHRDIIKYDFEVTTIQLCEQLFGYKFTVPMVADFKIGRHWGDNSRRIA